MECTLHDLFDSQTPIATLMDIVERGKRPESTSFEQYASKLLTNANIGKLANSPSAAATKILRPGDGRLAQLVASSGLPKTLEPTLLAVECAINRLVYISDAIADGTSSKDVPDKGPRLSISILGGGYLASGEGWRSTQVQLPDLDSTSDVSAAYYNEVDWRSIDCVADHSWTIFQHCIRPNAYRTTLGVHVEDQSDWDVRTRLAQLVGALELPHRYSFQFDCDCESKSVTVLFTCPPRSFLPPVARSTAFGIDQPKLRAYESYLIRLACLFGATCFGSGRTMETAVVAGYDSSWSKPLVSARFERQAFAKSVLAAIDAHEFSKPSLRFDPSSIADMVEADYLEWAGQNGLEASQPIPLATMATGQHRRDPGLDRRLLPQAARDLFRCKHLCDVDTTYYLGGHADAIDLARTDSDESTISAIMRLETLAEDLEANLHPPDDDVSARPLYAAHPLSRLAIGLLTEEQTIAEQAEAFLHGTELHSGEAIAPSYYKAPNALYHSHYGLSDLYQRLGDFDAARLQADRCIALAPTTASAYYRKADILAEQGCFTQAANVLTAGLRCAVVHSDCTLLYYHLGMLLWNMGEKEKSAAVHVYNASLKGDFTERSARIVEGLRRQEDAPDIVFKSAFFASREMKAYGLPIAPVDIRHQIAEAAIVLANAGSPEAAAPYARELERLNMSDEIVKAACRSLYSGISL